MIFIGSLIAVGLALGVTLLLALALYAWGEY